jgi:hypothetical protein
MAEEEMEDLMGRLEALRKKTPPEEPGPPPPSDEDARRKRLARIVGVFVLLIILGGGFFLIYNTLLKAPSPGPIPEGPGAPPAPEGISLPEAKTLAARQINEAFEGLPPDYTAARSHLLEKVQKAKSVSEIQAVDLKGTADLAWRAYWKDQVMELSRQTENIELNVGNDTYRTVPIILQKLNFVPYGLLKGASLREIRPEYVPLRLTRLQAAGGLVEAGDVVNVYHKEGGNITLLSKKARVMAILRGKESGSISLSETERKIASGEGAEGKGIVESVTGSGIGSVEGPFAASAGYKMTQTQSSYTVSIEEIQKAAAASKLPETLIEDALAHYGIRLNWIERETNIGNIDAEYLLLLEVSDSEAPALVSKVLTPEERKNLFITVAEPTLWMKELTG